MSEEIHSIPGNLIAIAHNVIKQAKVDIHTVSVTFDFENEKIEFECHCCNEIIKGLTTDFIGRAIS